MQEVEDCLKVYLHVHKSGVWGIKFAENDKYEDVTEDTPLYIKSLFGDALEKKLKEMREKFEFEN